MGNQKVTLCEHQSIPNECPFCGEEELDVSSESVVEKVKDVPEMTKVLKVEADTQLTAEIPHTEPTKKVIGRPFTGKNDPRNGRKKKGDLSYNTVFYQALKTLRDSKGRKITVHDVVRAGIMPMLKNIASGDPRFHGQYEKTLDRLFGKATERIDHTNNGGKFEAPATIIGMKIVKEK